MGRVQEEGQARETDMKFALRFAATVVLAAALASCASVETAGPLTVHMVGLNDFHGNLEPPAPVALPDPDNVAVNIPKDAGGAARMATLAGELLARPNSIMVAAGDLIGASPMLSAMFHDEPAVEALSAMGLSLSAVGNHEFDEGVAELHRMQNGGCHPVDGCKGPAPFKGAKYSYLAASAIEDATGKTVFPASAVRTFEGVKVGFIGLSLKGVPDLIAPWASKGLTFRDEAETINAEAAKLKAQGVQAIVVMIHEGGYPAKGAQPCEGLSGAITEIAPKLDKAVDVIVSGHTHMAYTCRIDGRLVTSAGRYSTMLTDITLTLDRKTKDIVASEARNIVVRKDRYAEDPKQVALIASFKALAGPLMNRVVGSIAEPMSKEAEPSGEIKLGSVIADAMREAAVKETGQAIDIAFMNAGGVRNGIQGDGGKVVFSNLYEAQPFGNTLVTMTLTGAQIETALRQQYTPSQNKTLQVSDGFSYRWRKDPLTGGALIPGSVMIGGKPLEPDRRYRIVTNNFVAQGGDGFVVFKDGKEFTNAGTDLDALEAYFKAHSPVAAPKVARIGVE